MRDTILRPADAEDQLVILFQPEVGSETEARLARLRKLSRHANLAADVGGHDGRPAGWLRRTVSATTP